MREKPKHRPHGMQATADPAPVCSSPPLSRRAFLGWMGACAAGSTLGACSPLALGTAGTGTAPADSPVAQLVYQDWRTDWFPPMAQEMIARFHDRHPDIRVFYTPDPEQFEDGMLSSFRAGTAPDVFQGCCTHFPAWAQLGYTLDLRPYVEADLTQATIDDWDPAQYRALFTPDGEQFGLPKYHGALALYYNKDLLDEYRVDYPDGTWDHDDYAQAMGRLTHDRNGDGKTDLWGSLMDMSWDRIQVHVNGWGGHLVDPSDPRRCLMAAPEALAAIEWLRARMWDDRVMATRLDVQNLTTRQAFVDQRVAMVEDGSWALKDILSGAGFGVGVAPFPAGPVRRVTLSTTDGFGIYAGTNYPDAAWELLKFLISDEYALAMARANFLQPARASLVGAWVDSIRDEFPEQAQDVDIAAFAEGHLQGYSVTAEVMANMADARRLANDAWEEILTWGRRPVGHLVDVCRQIEALQSG